MRQLLSLAALAALLIPTGIAQVRTEKRHSLKAEEASIVKNANANSPKPHSLTYANYELTTNVVIPAGQYVDVESSLDYSAATSVAVTVRSSSGNASNLSLVAYWSVPEALYWNVVDVAEGTDFYYSNVGGARFNVYGNQFMLRLMNTGTAGVVLSQVLVFVQKM